MEKQDIEQLLREGNRIKIKPQGYSMYPVLVPERDEVIIEPVRPENLKRGDVVLYRRRQQPGKGILVLHRIYKKDKYGFYMVGDNQTEIEGPLDEEQIRGIMTVLIKSGRYIDVRQPLYRLMTGCWLWLRPVRPIIAKAVSKVKKMIKKGWSRL